MPPHEAAALKGSIERFGVVEPLVWNERTRRLVGGHQRLDALQALGEQKAPVVVVDFDEWDERALALALNKIHGEWDWDRLSKVLDELAAANPELPSVAGFTEEELARIETDGHLLGLRTEEAREAIRAYSDSAFSDPQLDEIPKPPETATTRKGDVWILGEHRLVCGDSGTAADVDRLLAGAPIHLVNTDPPYNVKVEPRSNNAIAAGLSSFTQTHHQKLDVARHPEKSQPTTARMRAKDRPLENDFLDEAVFDALLGKCFGNLARVLLPGRGFYIWGGYSNLGNYPPALKAAGLYFSQAIVWDKGHPVLSRKDFMGAFELAYYGWREGAAHEFFGPNNVSDLWSVKKVAPQQMSHLTEKPVELAGRAILYSSRRKENVLDLFGGSGSTLVACEQTERHAFLMELDELYCDVIVTRWNQLTGEKAVLEGDGRSFEVIGAERRQKKTSTRAPAGSRRKAAPTGAAASVPASAGAPAGAASSAPIA
jgi:DNA modification methylase